MYSHKSEFYLLFARLDLSNFIKNFFLQKKKLVNQKTYLYYGTNLCTMHSYAIQFNFACGV